MPKYNNAQAIYMMLSIMESDASCISYISMSWPSGVNYMFFGDNGYQCDADWYHSDLIVDVDGSIATKPFGLRYQCTLPDF